jgi:hypothetical protein
MPPRGRDLRAISRIVQGQVRQAPARVPGIHDVGTGELQFIDIKD